MNVVVGEVSDTHIQAAITGEVDADNCAEMGSSLLGQGPSSAQMRIDVAELSFIDSSGISELLRVRQLMVDAGGSLELKDPTDNVRRVLEITGLTETFGL